MQQPSDAAIHLRAAQNGDSAQTGQNELSAGDHRKERHEVGIKQLEQKEILLDEEEATFKEDLSDTSWREN